MIPAMAEDGCRFLSCIDLRYFDIPASASDEQPGILELLQSKQFSKAFDLVRLGQVSAKSPLDGPDCSLLHLAMRRNFHQEPVLADVQALLESVELRGELLEEDDLLVACDSGMPALVGELLRRGAPLSRDGLHAAFGRSSAHPAREVLQTAELLLRAEADVDQLGSQGATAFSIVCGGIGNSMLKLMRWFLDKGADPCGANGRRLPLHAYVGGWNCRKEGVQMLVQGRADLNQREPLNGNTPLHFAIDPRTNFESAMNLKTLGADCSLVNNEGLRPSQLLLAKSLPELAAKLEDRPMNQEEQEMRLAMDHPVARRFEGSCICRTGWVIKVPPGRLTVYSEEFREPAEDADVGCTRLSTLLDGHSPKTVVLGLPLTRYSEIIEHVSFQAPELEGFTVKGLLTEIYNYYQECFTASQQRRIQRLHGAGKLGDTFGYIARNIPDPDLDAEGNKDVEDDVDPAAKRRAVRRIDLRGDSVFFEGFTKCKYYEKESKLCGSMLLGS